MAFADGFVGLCCFSVSAMEMAQNRSQCVCVLADTPLGIDTGVYAFWLILPLVLILGRRFLILRKTRKVKALETADAAVLKNRIVSPFDDVAEFLQHQGYVRLPGESLKTWISRICREGFAEKTAGELNVLVRRFCGKNCR